MISRLLLLLALLLVSCSAGNQPASPPTALPGESLVAYWVGNEDLNLIGPDGESGRQVFSAENQEGDYIVMKNPPGFSTNDQSYLFVTLEGTTDTLNFILVDVNENKVSIVQEFDLYSPIIPWFVFWLDEYTIVYSTVDTSYSGSLDSVPALMYSLDTRKPGEPVAIPLAGAIHHVEGVLPDGNLLVSSKNEENSTDFTRRVVNVNGEVISELDIDQKIADVIGRLTTGELLSIDINNNMESSTQPQILGDHLYLKKCAESQGVYTCHMLRVELPSSRVTEIFQSPGESINSIDVSPDESIILCRQCQNNDSSGSVSDCALKAYELKTGELLYEIKNGSKPSWSADSQFFVYLDQVMDKSLVKSSTLMRANRDGSETIVLNSENDRAEEPDWITLLP